MPGLKYSPNLDIYAKHLKTERQVLRECIDYYTYVLVEPTQKAHNNTLIRRWQARIEGIDAQINLLEKVRP